MLTGAGEDSGRGVWVCYGDFGGGAVVAEAAAARNAGKDVMEFWPAYKHGRL